MSIFGRIVVGIDGTEPGLEACRQAARLARPYSWVEAVAVVDIAQASRVGMNAPLVAAELEREGRAALDEAVGILGGQARAHLARGSPSTALLRRLGSAQATLVALGSHGHRRATEILLGGVAGELLHAAPCSVLVARPTDAPPRFPRSVTVGIDGSDAADLALAAAGEIASSFDVPVRAITALRGKNVDLARARRRAPSTEEIHAHPVEALVEASREADLVVLGSRGLHGLRALGSVSERVAHQASCSVLVVRPRHHP